MGQAKECRVAIEPLWLDTILLREVATKAKNRGVKKKKKKKRSVVLSVARHAAEASQRWLFPNTQRALTVLERQRREPLEDRVDVQTTSTQGAPIVQKHKNIGEMQTIRQQPFLRKRFQSFFESHSLKRTRGSLPFWTWVQQHPTIKATQTNLIA